MARADKTDEQQVTRLQSPTDERRWYALCGTRLYVIATLMGRFPDMGGHEPGEMGGVWAPPVKLLDGYWLGLREESQGVNWLTEPSTWEMGPEGVILQYALPKLGLQMTRREWVIPDESVLVLDVSIEQMPGFELGREQTIECLFAARSDLRGVWLAEERLGWTNGEDIAEFDDTLGMVTVRDKEQPWAVCFGATEHPIAHQLGKDVWGPERTKGRGTGVILSYAARVSSMREARLRFVIAGSSAGHTGAQDLFRLYSDTTAYGAGVSTGDDIAETRLAHANRNGSPLAADESPLSRAEHVAARRWLKPFQRSVLRSPDATLNRVFGWAKASASMLQLDVPDLGRGAMAGLPEFPWWFGCDLAYGILALLPAGQSRVARDSLSTLARISQRHSATGAVVHEVISNGLIFHPGNLVETPLFIRAVYHTYCWTGDNAWLTEIFPFCLRGLREWALGKCLQAGEVIPNGSSIVETPDMGAGLQTLDVAAYLVEALELLALLAKDLEQYEVTRYLRSRASAVRQYVQRVWWIPNERLFGDIRASQKELAELVGQFEPLASSSASHRASIELLQQVLATQTQGEPTTMRRPWFLGHMVQALAADAGLPTSEQAAQLLDRLETPEWTKQYGIVLNMFNAEDVMTLPTGAMAVGEARYGRIDQALEYVQRIAKTFGKAMPGAISEYSPDGGCFWQLWSSYGIVWPIVHYIFGVRPEMGQRRLLFAPQLPSTWPSAQLQGIPLSQDKVNVGAERLPNGLRVQIDSVSTDLEVALGVVLPVHAHVRSAALNGRDVTLRPTGLREREGRTVWTTPYCGGRTEYELVTSWEEG